MGDITSHVTPRPDEVHNTCNCRGAICALNAIVKDKIVKFSNNCGTFTIKESGGGESIINRNLNSKLIIINCQNNSGKSRKFRDDETDCAVKFVSRNLVT